MSRQYRHKRHERIETLPLTYYFKLSMMPNLIINYQLVKHLCSATNNTYEKKVKSDYTFLIVFSN